MALRSLLCAEHQIGLNGLYNHLDDGAFQALRRLHEQLDHAVASGNLDPSYLPRINPEA